MSRITNLSKLYVHSHFHFWSIGGIFLAAGSGFCIVHLKKCITLMIFTAFVENKITAHLNLILWIEAGRQTLSTVWLLSVWRCLTVSMTLHWYQYHLECTLVSILTNAEDQWYLFYQVYTVLYKHFIYHDSRALFIYPDLKIQAGLLNIDTGVNSTKHNFLSFILNVIYTIYFC